MLDLKETEKPSRYSAYRATEKGSAQRQRYETGKGKETRSQYLARTYLSREFIAWDGEGITIDGEHRFVMLANSKGAYLENLEGLPTLDVFEMLLTEKSKYPDAIHIIYGGGYDINMSLKDLSHRQVRGLYLNDWYTIGGYRLQWRRGKSLFIGRTGEKGGITLYDVMPFFQCAFVKACDEYLGDRFRERELIVSNKGARSSFRPEDLAEIKYYNEMELVNLVELASELRIRLDKVGLRLQRWDGPGAIAAALLTKQGVKSAMNKCPDPVAKAARHAYAGGRFEVVRNGAVDDYAYEYDVNSAYPYGLGFVPNLANGEWIHSAGERCVLPGWNTYALYRVHYRYARPEIPGPLYRRHKRGQISYPLSTEGWYWGPDVYAASVHAERYDGILTVYESWTFIENDPNDKPFAFIEPLFNKRRALKAAGDGAHVGIKLGLNSLYGKLCQQVGFRTLPDGRMIPPSFHQLEWAGYVTAMCRSKVLLAAIDDLECVIAYETDALFTSKRLDVPTGTGLGEWEETVFRNLTYAQSGLYFAETDKGAPVAKTRGVDRGSLTREMVESAMLQPLAADRYVQASLTRFIGAGLALQTKWATWRTWHTMPKTIDVEPNGKRVHRDCDMCASEGGSITPGVWHHTFAPFYDNQFNYEFPIAWINPDPNMAELEELRDSYAENRSLYNE